MSNTVKRVIFDGQSLLAMAQEKPLRRSPDGRDVTSLFAATQIIRSAIKEYAPTHATVVLSDDAHNRDTSESAIDLVELADSLGLQVIRSDIDHASLMSSVIVAGHDIPTLVVTNNFSFARHINGNLSIQNASDGTVVDIDRLSSQMAILPKHLDLFVALAGDPDRNLKGIPMIGPKTALALVQEHADFESLSHAARTDPSTAALKSVAKNLDQIKLNLAHIQNIKITDVDAPQPRRSVNPQKLYPNYIKHGFGLWLPEKLRQMHSHEPVQAKELAVVLEINSQETLERALQTAQTSKTWAIHTKLDQAKTLRRIGLCPQEGLAYEIDCSSSASEHHKEFLSKLVDIHNKNQPKLLCMDAKADYKAFKKIGFDNPQIFIDCKTLSYVLDPTNVIDQISSAAESKLGIIIHSKGTGGHANAYASDALLRMSKHLYKSAQAEEWAWKHFKDIELPVSKVIAEMEIAGAYVNSEPLVTLGDDLKLQLGEIEKRLAEIAGESFNPNSPAQLAIILFNNLGLGTEEQRKKGSTSEAVLSELSEHHELPGLVLKHRKLSNLNGPYTEGLLSKVNNETGRIHSTFNQTVAITGRLSSSDPNLQSIPVRSAEGKRIRQAFCGENGNRIIAADYSQIELRVLAHLSGDQKLIAAFRDGIDIHKATAAEIFDIPLEQVTGIQRRNAKAVNFGLIYGKTSYSLAKDLNISEKEASTYIDTYFARYPVVKSFLEQCKASARTKGYAETSQGRRIPVKGIHSSEYSEKSKALRTACNYPMQGTAADIIKKAMIDTAKALRETDLNAKLVLQVHDELIFEVSKGDMNKAVEVIRHAMQDTFELKVPLMVDVEAGLNWEQSHSIDAKTNKPEEELEVAS